MVDIPAVLQANWPQLVKHGCTKTCTYQQMPDPDYDANAGEPVDQDPISETHIEVVFDQFSNMVIDGEAIRVIDREALFPTMDLPVVPRINDRIVDPSTTVWRVVSGAPSDPADAHYSLHVRPVGVL